MRADLRGLIELIGQTVLAPADVARQIVAMPLSRAVLWQALLLVTILSVLVTAIVQGSAPELPAGGQAPIPVSPLTYGVILGASLVLLVFALHYTGQAMGGTGSFGATLAIVVWLEVMAVAVRLVQGTAAMISAPLGGFLSLLGLGVLLWSVLNFVNVLHGFESLLKSGLTLILAVIGISIGIAIMLTIIGVGATGGTS